MERFCFVVSTAERASNGFVANYGRDNNVQEKVISIFE